MRALSVIAASFLVGGALANVLVAWHQAMAVEAPRSTTPREPVPLAADRTLVAPAPAPLPQPAAVEGPATEAPRRPAPVAVDRAPIVVDRAPPPPVRAPAASDETLFSNTYYDFPVENGGVANTPLYTPRCELISVVPASFHDRLCVQGSGRLASGETVSFGGRDCACAAVCPRTGQRICYEVLDAARFPCGRGATGHPITPLRTVAVDPTVIPMGALLYIPELAGLPTADGSPHDGCFVAEDKGLNIKGRRIDVYTGSEETRRAWEAAFPSHAGVHVYSGSTRCKAEAPRPRRGCDARLR